MNTSFHPFTHHNTSKQKKKNGHAFVLQSTSKHDNKTLLFKTRAVGTTPQAARAAQTSSQSQEKQQVIAEKQTNNARFAIATNPQAGSSEKWADYLSPIDNFN